MKNLINKQSVLQNLSDLNTDIEIPKELKDAIERVTDDVKEMLEVLDDIHSNYSI